MNLGHALPALLDVGRSWLIIVNDCFLCREREREGEGEGEGERDKGRRIKERW